MLKVKSIKLFKTNINSILLIFIFCALVVSFISATRLSKINIKTLDIINFDPKSIHIQSLDIEGFDPKSIHIQSLDIEGFDPKSIHTQSLDIEGFNPKSIHTQSLDIEGFNPKSIHIQSLDIEIFNKENLAIDSLNTETLDKENSDKKRSYLNSIDLYKSGINDDPNIPDLNIDNYNINLYNVLSGLIDNQSVSANDLKKIALSGFFETPLGRSYLERFKASDNGPIFEQYKILIGEKPIYTTKEGFDILINPIGCTDNSCDKSIKIIKFINF